MGFFSRKKDPAVPVITKVPSNTSTHSVHTLKLLLKPKPQTEVPVDKNLLIPKIVTNDVKIETNDRNRRVSTIVEDEQHADFEGDDFEIEDDASDFESEDDDYEEHTHALIPRHTATVSQLSALMGLVGLSHTKEALKKLANEELRRTFSLISSDLKINRLLPTMSTSDPHLFESVIGDLQMKLIDALTSQLNKLMDALLDLDAQYRLVDDHRTLFDRYGNFKDVIGRGAYGVIKIVDPDDNADGFAIKNKVYAVKELQQRTSTDKNKETRELFLERAVSEFIISSTLNNKHIVRTLDFLVTLPPRSKSGIPVEISENSLKISQVMDCTNGGDFFSYIKQSLASRQYISIDEIDCMVKQITKGLWYMHNHGVAHCDLKLENILITYDTRTPQEGQRGKMNLKLSDFGKSNVVRTKWDAEEQLSTSGPVGSGPYIAPEEYIPTKKGYSLIKKDCWALGVLILVLFNVRRSYFVGKYGEVCQLGYYDEQAHEDTTKNYSSSYLWRTTEAKTISLSKHRKYKDEVFDEYVRSAMVADYDKNTKEWTIHSPGKFLPIETLFDAKDDGSMFERDAEFEEDDFLLRKYFIYKLLDINARTRASVDMVLRSDWLSPVECCCE